jgi:hypothetical protein
MIMKMIYFESSACMCGNALQDNRDNSYSNDCDFMCLQDPKHLVCGASYFTSVYFTGLVKSILLINFKINRLIKLTNELTNNKRILGLLCL